MSQLWPAIDTERHEWVSTLDPGLLDVWQRHRLDRPYEASVPPTIASLPVVLDHETAAVESEATAEIVRFDAELASLPVPMPAILLRTESASSSQIERLTSDARNIAIAELDLPSKQDAELVVANVRAMQRALEVGPSVTRQSILDIHEVLLGHSEPDLVGAFRTEQVWIGGADISPHAADFIPPHAERVPGLIDDLVVFAARTDIPVLAHAALVHAQFETIHPFLDGNGRTGRAVMHAVLRARGLTRNSTVPVSSGLLRDTSRYFDALTAYRAGDPDAIVVQASEAAFAAVTNGRRLAREMTTLREELRAGLRARADSAAWRLIDLLMRQPVVNAERVSRELEITARSARNALDQLTESGAITPASTAKRDRIWQAPAVLAAMDAFARRAGRRVYG